MPPAETLAMDPDNRLRLDQLFVGDPLASSLGISIVDWGNGQAVVTATPSADQCNFVGGVHGGFLFSMADVAMSVASNSYGRICVAVTIDIHYLKGVVVDDALVATATEVNRSRGLATFDLLLHRGDELVSKATGMTYRTRRWHLGQDAWSEEWRSAY